MRTFMFSRGVRYTRSSPVHIAVPVRRWKCPTCSIQLGNVKSVNRSPTFARPVVTFYWSSHRRHIMEATVPLIATAWLIHATTMTSGFEPQNVTTIPYPTMEICEAKARELKSALHRPAAMQQRHKDKVVLLIDAKCVDKKPSWWIENGS